MVMLWNVPERSFGYRNPESLRDFVCCLRTISVYAVLCHVSQTNQTELSYGTDSKIRHICVWISDYSEQQNLQHLRIITSTVARA